MTAARIVARQEATYIEGGKFGLMGIVTMVDLLSCRVSVCGVAELLQFADQRVTHVLSILDPMTPDPVAFRRFPSHARRYLQFHDIVAEHPGFEAPGRSDVEDVLAFGETIAAPADGEAHLLVHCQMGISRSTAAAAILLTQARAGTEEDAFRKLFTVRPRAWPNSRMVHFADDLLRRDGALIEALRRHQRRILEHHPDIAELVASVGRGQELPV